MIFLHNSVNFQATGMADPIYLKLRDSNASRSLLELSMFGGPFYWEKEKCQPEQTKVMLALCQFVKLLYFLCYFNKTLKLLKRLSKPLWITQLSLC